MWRSLHRCLVDEVQCGDWAVVSTTADMWYVILWPRCRNISLIYQSRCQVVHAWYRRQLLHTLPDLSRWQSTGISYLYRCCAVRVTQSAGDIQLIQLSTVIRVLSELMLLCWAALQKCFGVGIVGKQNDAQAHCDAWRRYYVTVYVLCHLLLLSLDSRKCS